MTYEQVKKPSSSVVPVQKKVSGFAPPASRVQAKDVTAGEQEQMPLGSTPATDANWLMKHPLFKGNQFLQRVVAPASESESLESEESLAQRETVQRQEEGKETGTPYSLPVQAKLTIGEPGDKYEQEADRVASQVVEQINSPDAAQPTQGQSVQRQEQPEEELQRQPSISDLQRSPLPLEVQREAMPAEEELQASSILQRREAIARGEASTDLDTAINSARGGGQPLDAGLQRSMGQAMGADFSGVRVHTDAKSDELNQSIQAKAFTTGKDVFFRSGAYEPGSRGGQELLAHELTHVVQQSDLKEGFRMPKQSGTHEERRRLKQGIPSDHATTATIQRKGTGGTKIAIEKNGKNEEMWNKFKEIWAKEKETRREEKRKVTEDVQKYSTRYKMEEKKGQEWDEHKNMCTRYKEKTKVQNVPPDSLTMFYAIALESIESDKNALRRIVQENANWLKLEGEKLSAKSDEGETWVEIAVVYEGGNAYTEVRNEKTMENTNRPVFSKKVSEDNEGSGEKSKEYVKDDRDVFTRRYAYVEKNYWQMMEFFMLNHMEGRFTQLMKAAGEKVGPTKGISGKANKIRGAAYKNYDLEQFDLTDTQLAVLHQWMGSSEEQRGVSLTSTPKVGATYVNTGENFRTNEGFRMTVDLSLVPREKAKLLNHYSEGGIAETPEQQKDYDKMRYKYEESATHARELYLEYLKPEWVVAIEYHPEAKAEGIVAYRGANDVEEWWEEQKERNKVKEYAMGFEKGLMEESYGNESETWKKGYHVGEAVNKGYKAGENAKPKEESTIRERFEKMVKETGGANISAKSQYQVGYMRGISGKERFKSIKDYIETLTASGNK
jgi:hypothetical protein